jgi:cyclopropane fatty-acyl-phospholipid synthase-like methyltransferase
MTESRDATHFQRLYEASPDPWQFRTSAYEQAKYRRTIASLADRRFRSGFEVGCSVGVLTRSLADRCDTLLAVDIVEAPLPAARNLCVDHRQVRFERMQVPGEWPNLAFDLIVLSEVLYFLSPADIASVADRVCATLDPDGVVVLVNWRGRSGDPPTGDEAATIFMNNRRQCLSPLMHYREDAYRLDVLRRTRQDWPSISADASHNT